MAKAIDRAIRFTSRFTSRFTLLVLGLAVSYAAPSFAQTVQIPTLQVCNITKFGAYAFVQIDSRADIAHTGTFLLRGQLVCDPAGTPYPTGVLGVFGLSMSDSTVQGDIIFDTFEQVTSTGKHTPTAWVNGRCTVRNIQPTPAPIIGCHYWLMVADNNNPTVANRTPDIVSLFVVDATGKRIAYGTGPVVDGDLSVSPTSN